MNALSIYKGLPRSIYVLFFAQVINRFGDFVIPFLTLYLTQKLNFSLKDAGIIVMIASFMGVPGSLYGGEFADKIGRKKTYIVAQTLAGIFFIPCIFINNEWIIIICICLSTLFNGAVRPPMNAFVADVLPPHERQRGYSLIYLGINVGMSLGFIVAGFLFNNHIKLLFIGDAITSFIAVFLVAKNIPKGTSVPLQNSNICSDKKDGFIKALFKSHKILFFFIIYILYSFVSSQHAFALPITLNNIFNDSGAKKFGYLMSINTIVVVFLTPYITTITAKKEPLSNITVAGILYAIGFGMIGFIQVFELFIISTIIWTIGEILIVTNVNVYIANNSPIDYRARFSSIGYLSWVIGTSISTPIIGKYIDFIGDNMVWCIIFIISIISSVFMYVLNIYNIKELKITKVIEKI